MKIIIPQPLPDHYETLIRRAGYGEHRDRHTPQKSYTRRLTPEFYPRFHVYIEEHGNNVCFNLHLDQKRPSYGGDTSAHSGEYEGPVVEREGERIREFIKNYQTKPSAGDEPNKKGFFSKIFG
ncbi:MAG: hypothetical protein UT32_C0027G0002 [Parcubacteria group bacterium GW2011_GWC2_39_14]|nr:MAG: hypothetical protein UT32_C0027G0002 [Parcubacteria group bacterium GW2011_GWC2_39_14]